MFGGMFGGEDVNENAMGGGDAGQAYYDQNFSQEGGMGQVGSFGGPSAGDPAEEASQASMQNLQGVGGAAGASQSGLSGVGGGLAGGLFNAIDPRGRSVRRRQRVFARHQAQYQTEQAQRNLAQYIADSAIQEQKLSQSYSARGLGSSSINDEGMKYFRETRDRTEAGLRQYAALMADQQSLVHSQIRASYVQPYVQMVGGILQMV